MKHPNVPFALLLATGIVAADAWAGASPALMVAIGAGLLLGAIGSQWMSPGRRQTWVFGLLTGLAMVCLGYGRMALTRPVSALGDERKCYEIKLVSIPERTNRGYKATARVEGEKVMVSFPEPLQRGDKILAYCQFSEPAAASHPHQFDYRRYLRRKGICRTARLHEGEYEVVQRGGGVVARLREQVSGAIRSSSLSAEQRGIAEALVLGYPSGVDADTQRLFRNAGIMHLLCVSGLHVGIISMILASLLFWLVPLSRHYLTIKRSLQIVGIWCYAIFTGMSPSTVRAAVMLTIILLGRAASLQQSQANNLASAALLMLIVEPGQLFDIGFQLSFAAVGGICLFYNKITHLWQPANKRVQSLWQFAVLSIVTQLGCAPIILYYFHQITPYFLLANLCIVPFAGLILGSCFVMVAVARWKWLFGIVGWLVRQELTATEWVTRLVSAIPGSLIDDVNFPWPMLLFLLGIYAVLYYALPSPSAWPERGSGNPFLSILLGHQKRVLRVHYRHRWILLMLLVSLYAVTATAISMHRGHQERLIVYSTPYATAVEHLHGHHSTLYLSDSSDITYQRQGYIVAHGIRHTDTIYGQHLIHYHGETFYLIDRDNHTLLRDTFPLHVDYLLISETPWTSPPELRAVIPFDTLMLTANNSPRYTPLWHALCSRDSIPLIDLSLTGAWEMK